MPSQAQAQFLNCFIDIFGFNASAMFSVISLSVRLISYGAHPTTSTASSSFGAPEGPFTLARKPTLLG